MSDYFIQYLSTGDREAIEWRHGGSTDHSVTAVPTLTRSNLPDFTFTDNAHLIFEDDHFYEDEMDPGKLTS